MPLLLFLQTQQKSKKLRYTMVFGQELIIDSWQLITDPKEPHLFSLIEFCSHF
jgi:hypothetical protein